MEYSSGTLLFLIIKSKKCSEIFVIFPAKMELNTLSAKTSLSRKEENSNNSKKNQAKIQKILNKIDNS